MKKEIHSVLYRILVVLYFIFATLFLLEVLLDWNDEGYSIGDKFLAVIIFLTVTEVLRGIAYYIRTGKYQSLILSLFKK